MENEIVYPAVYEPLSEYCHAVVSELSREFDADSVPQQTRWEVRDTEDGSTEHARVLEPDYFQLLASNKELLAEIPGYAECIEAFLTNDVYQDQLPRVTDGEGNEVEDPDYEDWVRNETLIRILAYYLEQNEGLQFDESVFNNVYREYAQYLTADELAARSWAVLHRFEMEPSELLLNDDLRIRAITDDECGFLVGQSRAVLNPVSHREIHGDYVVEYEYTVPKGGSRSTQDAGETFRSVTTALKLFPNGGDTRYVTMISEQLQPFSFGGSGNQFSEGEAITSTLRQSCELSADECDAFRDFWGEHRIHLRNPPDTLQIAVHRYADAFKRDESENRLIDLVIALEAALLKPGERQELSYRLSQRGALLLADDKERAAAVRDQLKDAYNERSNVVHGVRDEVDRGYVRDVQELMRQVLLELLERAPRGKKEHRSVLDELDEKALDPR